MPIRYDTARIEKRYLFDMVDIPHKDILEIGSGDGRLTWQYAEEARSVTAIDLSESELQQGATIAQEKRGDSRFLLASALDLPFVRSCFDHVIFAWSF